MIVTNRERNVANFDDCKWRRFFRVLDLIRRGLHTDRLCPVLSRIIEIMLNRLVEAAGVEGSSIFGIVRGHA